MLYGNSSMGYGYSPDRRKDVVNHYGYKSQLLGANGSRQGGYCSASDLVSTARPTSAGWYDGAGRYHER